MKVSTIVGHVGSGRVALREFSNLQRYVLVLARYGEPEGIGYGEPEGIEYDVDFELKPNRLQPQIEGQ